jgi:antitoxin YefM
MASVLDRVANGSKNLAIRRNGKRIVVAVPSAEWEGLKETVHLLSSPRNAQRVLNALARAKAAGLRNGDSLSRHRRGSQ